MSKLNKEDVIPFFTKWLALRTQLESHFIQRTKVADDLMEDGIRLLRELIDLADGTYPLNFEERFRFIQQNNKTYAAFRQLDELFKETEKKLARRFVMESKRP